tara:strand:+ start:115 stop:588 length:474 start_codon:yes stop_codon:yes gene_type:complete
MSIEKNDISLEYNCEKNYFDLELVSDDSDLLAAVNLRTGISISLFSDRRSLPEDPVPNARGWAGDAIRPDDTDLIGSRLWLLQQEKTLDSNLPRIEQYCQEALQWLLDENVAESFTVDAEYISKPEGKVGITIEITRLTGESRRFEYVWEQKLIDGN